MLGTKNKCSKLNIHVRHICNITVQNFIVQFNLQCLGKGRIIKGEQNLQSLFSGKISKVCGSCQIQAKAVLTILSVFDAHSVHNIEDFDMTVAMVENFGWYVHTLQNISLLIFKANLQVNLNTARCKACFLGLKSNANM